MAIFKTATRASGDRAEALVKRHLESEGLKCIEQNYTCKLGEIDLIMQEQSTLAFVEVRYRKSSTFGGAAASVGIAKQKKIRNTATYYLMRKNLFDKCPVRFDVVAVSDNDISWIKGAF